MNKKISQLVDVNEQSWVDGIIQTSPYDHLKQGKIRSTHTAMK